MQTFCNCLYTLTLFAWCDLYMNLKTLAQF
uniref:Uncharacterized protein n=1 Tax=Ciona intestinalis TaxID=7719 RepID=H2Y1B8_CIOIN